MELYINGGVRFVKGLSGHFSIIHFLGFLRRKENIQLLGDPHLWKRPYLDHLPSLSHVFLGAIAIALDPWGPQVALPQGVSFDAEQQRYTVETGWWHHRRGDFYDSLKRVLDHACFGHITRYPCWLMII